MPAITVEPKAAQAMVMAFLRSCNYTPMRTSELSRALGVQPSCIRRAGLALVAKGRLRADLVPGRGRGEYLFTLQQLDLFEDHKEPPNLWQRIKGFFK